MIIMGAGTNHWFHSDTIYRTFLALTTMTGCQGINGGGWAHYVGQEKCAADDRLGAVRLRPATGSGRPADDRHGLLVPLDRPVAVRRAAAPICSRRPSAKACSQAARLRTPCRVGQASGWMPSYPTFNRNPLDLCDEARPRRAKSPRRLRRPTAQERRPCTSPCEDPDAPENFPRVISVWRANLLGFVRQGQRVLPEAPARCRLGNAAPRRAPRERPRDIVWRDEAPSGKLDLLVTASTSA
jgi:nitrate reductase alpha subunit